MAILLCGKTKCPTCGIVIEEGDEAVLFPHFILNENDPRYGLSDTACHLACLDHDPIGASMLAASKQYLDNTGPGKRICVVCRNEIRDPDDYLFIGYLAEPSNDPLGKFNYTHLHKSHISDWEQAEEFLALARAALVAEQWRGKALSEIVQEIEARKTTELR
jgi:hypothetical protein